MKKIIVIVLISLSYFLYHKSNVNQEEVFAVRIVANSNSKEDQDLKVVVKEKVMQYLEKNYSFDYTNYVNNLEINLSKLEQELKIISNEIKVDFENHNIGYKEYTNNEVKKYFGKTLYVEIGKATGDNFFSIIYPYYEETENVVIKSFVYEIFNARRT